MRDNFRATASTGHGTRHARDRFWRHSAALVVAVTLGIAALAISPAVAPPARAAGGDAIVHWDSSMIYAGHNNGFPYGPVGEHAIG